MLRLIIITLIIGGMNYGAWKKDFLDLKGSLGSFIIGWLSLYAGIMYFLSFTIFMAAGSLAAKYKTKRKAEKGELQKARGIGNVLANGLIPLLFILIEIYTARHVYLAGFFGSIATANADTLASEIGMLSKSKPRLITTLENVEPGKNGAITLLGEISAIAGSLMISVIPILFLTEKVGLVFFSSLLAGFVGSNFDSLIGATLERKGWIGNDFTNFLAVSFGGIVGILIFMMLF